MKSFPDVELVKNCCLLEKHRGEKRTKEKESINKRIEQSNNQTSTQTHLPSSIQSEEQDSLLSDSRERIENTSEEVSHGRGEVR
jgi:hypothetical protein